MIDLGNSFEKYQLLFALQAHLTTAPETFLGMVLLKAIKDQKPAGLIISYIQDFCTDNKPLVEKVIPTDLLEKILNLKK